MSTKSMGQPEAEAGKLGDVLGANPVPTFSIDTNGNVTHWNRPCELLTGTPAEKIIGTVRHRQIFYSDGREVMADFIVKKAAGTDLYRRYRGRWRRSGLIRDGYECEDFFPTLGLKGKWLLFTAAPLKGARGRTSGAVETIQDITHLRTAEQELRTSKAHYLHLFEAANDAIIFLKDGVIADCNRKALELFNNSRKRMIGLPFLALSAAVQPGGVLSKYESREREFVANKKAPQIFDRRFVRKDGTHFDAEVSLSRFQTSGAPYGLAIVRDVTVNNEILGALRERERELDEKTRYLETVNQALKASLDYREVEKRSVEESLLVDLKRFVFPYMEELDRFRLSPDVRAYLNVIGINLNDIVSRCSSTLFSKYIDFTPTEIRVADFARTGRSIKETARLLGISPSSVKWHRKHIRNKLGLTNKKVSLYTYLNSLRG